MAVCLVISHVLPFSGGINAKCGALLGITGSSQLRALFADMALGTRDVIVIRCTYRVSSVSVEEQPLEREFGAPLALIVLAMRTGSAETLNTDHQDPCRMAGW